LEWWARKKGSNFVVLETHFLEGLDEEVS